VTCHEQGIVKMARGGFRAGAGRPRTKPALPPKDKAKKTGSREVVRPVKSTPNMMPLDYMLAVMRDEAADEVRRDRMAIAAAAYIHEKAADRKLGKKEQREATAKASDKLYALNRSKIELVIDND